MSTLAVDTIQNLAGDERFGPVLMNVVTPSGVSTVDFTGIPSWVKRITMQLGNLSGSSTGAIGVRVGNTASGIKTTGYSGMISGMIATSSNAAVWGGTCIEATLGTAAAGGTVGHVVITRLGVSDIWVASSIASASSAPSYILNLSTGYFAIADLDRVQLYLASGTFDGGSVNVIYE